MDGQVNRLIRLTQGLLFMARLDQQPAEISQEVIEFDEFIDGILEQFVPLAAEKNISLQNQSPHPISFVGDVDLLIRLFLNLFDNAIKYTQAGGAVTIRALANQATVSISIQDNGPGIAQGHIPHLFDRFFQIESSRSRLVDKPAGAGLGLAIAHEIARIHGGTLRVESRLGHGSTFTLELPTILKKTRVR